MRTATVAQPTEILDELIRRLIAVSRFLLEQLRNDRLYTAGERWINAAERRRHHASDRVCRRGNRTSIDRVGKLSRETLIEHHADRVEIAPLFDGTRPLELLRTHVRNRTHKVIRGETVWK